MSAVARVLDARLGRQEVWIFAAAEASSFLSIRPEIRGTPTVSPLGALQIPVQPAIYKTA